MLRKLPPFSAIHHAVNPNVVSHQPARADHLGPVIELFEDLFALYPDDREPKLFWKKPPQPTVRAVIKAGHRTHYVGYFYSRKNDRLIPFESALEMDGLLLLEGSPGVQAYIVQPCRLPLNVNGRQTYVVPDVLVLGDRRWYLEFKYEKTSRRPKWGDRFERLQYDLSLQGIDYQVWTEERVRGPRLNQIRGLYEAARWVIEPSVRRETARWLVTRPAGTYASTRRMLSRYPVAVAALDGFILDGLIDVDMNRALDQQVLAIDTLRFLQRI